MSAVVFKTSRFAEFCSVKELTAQTGHDQSEWPLVALKELVDNALDAAEDMDAAPVVEVIVDEEGIAVTDNGPGIAPETVADLHDSTVRVSSREAYAGPTRGARGNALKTLLAVPYVSDGESGTTVGLGIPLPDDLHERIEAYLIANPAPTWDEALRVIMDGEADE